LTSLFLQACEAIRVPDPGLYLRWHRNMNAEIKMQAVRMLVSGLSMPILLGDEQTAGGLIHAGIPVEESQIVELYSK
jgi:pyruvate-formate lyase